MAVKCVSIRSDQEDFILSQKKTFNLSKFVQSKLDDYMKAIKDYKEFMEE